MRFSVSTSVDLALLSVLFLCSERKQALCTDLCTVPRFVLCSTCNQSRPVCGCACVFPPLAGAYDDILRPYGVVPNPSVCYVMFLDRATLRAHRNSTSFAPRPDLPGHAGVWRLVLVNNLPFKNIRKSRAVRIPIYRPVTFVQ